MTAFKPIPNIPKSSPQWMEGVLKIQPQPLWCYDPREKWLRILRPDGTLEQANDVSETDLKSFRLSLNLNP